MLKRLTALMAAACLAVTISGADAKPRNNSYKNTVASQFVKAQKVAKAKKIKRPKQYRQRIEAPPIIVDRHGADGVVAVAYNSAPPTFGTVRQRATPERVGPAHSFAGIHRPNVWIAGRLSCARNVNAALAAMGRHGTGSAMAKSFLTWGSASGPLPGAVAVYNRGRNPKAGHVAIVSRVVGGTVYIWNPVRGRGWVEMPQRRTPIAYRA